MAIVPKMNLVDKIDAVTIESYPRPHLGYSTIGNQCKRAVAYQFYWTHTKAVEGRLERIFRMGDSIELLLVTALESIGIEVDIGLDGGQHRVSDETGHIGGSLDGILRNVPDFEGQELLFEGKSMNHTNFLDMKRKGVQGSKPVHYVQMNMYMGRLDLEFGMYVAMDKNTQELYIEILPFDRMCYDHHNEAGEHILSLKHINELPKISHNPSWFACKICDSKDVCHKGEPVAMNCRTCEHSAIVQDGKWGCLMVHKELSVKAQETGCGSYEMSEMWK